MDLRALNQNRFDAAKQLWGFAVAAKFFLFLVAAIDVFSKSTFFYTPLLLLFLAITAEILQWKSDTVKEQSETLLRKLDMRENFQEEISEADKREILLTIPPKVLQQIPANTTDTYFSSKQPNSPRKALENLAASAGYTKYLCDDMAKFCVCIMCALVLLSVVALIITTREVGDMSTQTDISKVVTAWLLLVFSLDIFKNACGYHKMHQCCLKTKAVVEGLLRSSGISEADASRQWREYQLDRSSAPLLPNWLWRIRKVSLDRAWESAVTE